MKRILLILLVPAFLHAETLFEDHKKTSDPYISDNAGFNSLFVNPAGAAGKTDFELSVSQGFNSSLYDARLLIGLADIALGAQQDGVESVADAGTAFSKLYEKGIINDDLLDALFEGTALDPDTTTYDWNDPSSVQSAVDSFSPADTDQVLTNLEAVFDDSTAQHADFYAGIPDEVSVRSLTSIKTGLLIAGFGLGVYDHAVAVTSAEPDPMAPYFGVNTLFNEFGVLAGGGFTVAGGKLALGFAGNYSFLLGNNGPVNYDNFMSILDGTDSIRYGYSWGLDVGAIWRPSPSLNLGVVFNNVMGQTETDLPRLADGLMGLLGESAYMPKNLFSNYKVSLDMDAGMSWEPDWKAVQPSLSFDLYNVVDYAREVSGDNFTEAMYRSLEYMRFGANFKFFGFLKVGAQYHDHFFNLGAGMDLLFLELYGEVKVHENFLLLDDYGNIPVGADLMLRLHF